MGVCWSAGCGCSLHKLRHHVCLHRNKPWASQGSWFSPVRHCIASWHVIIILYRLMIQVFASKTSAQNTAISRAVSYEFRFGEHYARQLMIFSMVIMFSISTPLISPVGLLYIIMKHVVDKHNLAWINLPSKIDLKVHRSAINFVIFAVGMLQFYMTTLSVVRNLK